MDWAEIEYPDEKRCGQERGIWWTERLGAAVFPAAVIKRGDWIKQPYPRGWQNPANCAQSGEEVLKLWKKERGWAQGDCGVLLDRFVLVDLDTKLGRNGFNGKEKFKEVVAKLGLDLWQILSGAFVYETPGRSGGVHILWKRPDNPIWSGLQKVVPADGIEIIGNRHYMLAPCSKRPDKINGLNKYKLISYPGGGLGGALDGPPEELWDFLLRSRDRRGNGNGNGNGAGMTGGGGKPSLKTALVLSLREIAELKVYSGQRHDVLFVEAARRAACGGSVEEVVEWMMEILGSGAFDGIDGAEGMGGEDEIERMARNAVKWAEGQEKEEFYGMDFDVGEIIKSSHLIVGTQTRKKIDTERSLSRWVEGRRWHS